MKKLVFPLAFACLLLGACSLSGGRGDNDCVYRERDLTVNWYSRSYWCVPDGRTPAPQPARNTAGQ